MTMLDDLLRLAESLAEDQRDCHSGADPDFPCLDHEFSLPPAAAIPLIRAVQAARTHLGGRCVPFNAALADLDRALEAT